MSYVSAAGQVERGPHSVGNATEERPRKRAKTDDGPSAFEKPPDWMKNFYKRYQKFNKYALEAKLDLVECDSKSSSFSRHLVKACEGQIPEELKKLKQTFSEFLGWCTDCGDVDWKKCEHPEWATPPVYLIHDMPGLSIYPNLLPQNVQIALLDRLLHRDLSNPEHQTNVHTHYEVPYPPPAPGTNGPGSFFDASAKDLVYKPKQSHAAINTERLLDKKLRWITLGGQYDWTAKEYPAGPPPPFPNDIKTLLEKIFPMKAEAAIVNFYSPGETLSMHRDVSEECAQPLVSVSLGCEAVFVCGRGAEDATASETRISPIKLRSGDALLMSGESRYAWHGVPKVLPETCPEWLQDWPAVGKNEERFAAYKGWMKRKRVNLNVRQMFADE